MKWCAVICLLFALVACDELPLAEPCNEELCQLPDCRCSSTDIPGGLQARDTPQFVLVTVDDNINILNIVTYREIFYNRQNSNSCPSGVTFYINHEYNNYVFVNELYNQGFEIALHSITHQLPVTYWKEATEEVMAREFGDQKSQMSHFANIPYESINGMRVPFLELGGNSTYQAVANHGLLYDHTRVTIENVDPGMWPYTLDYASTQDCVIEPCPTASIPGAWVLPMITWTDTAGNPCAMVDDCSQPPPVTDEEAWFRMIVYNFERHYLGTRAPFGVYIHEWYLRIHPAVKRAIERFMDLVNNLDDAFMVNSRDVIEWVKNPVNLTEYRQQPCKTFVPTTCARQNCGPLDAEEHQPGYSYWMEACVSCPRVYPWLNNPLGL
ncbi:chitin deacetylase 8-like [Achroia grisella]|uniref:chitin deacetylase 8-like n=1 Tax=Achroia grisella TaxID=688607 RepID=UPI0027D25B64|nr:chitin deacetylase 8-like [Achroia grisella]